MTRPIFTLALILATSVADAHFPIAQRLRQMDTNHDRALSLEEVLAARQTRFVALDADRNQVLTLAEISSNLSSRLTSAKRADAKQEALDRIGKRFSRLDKNQDGRITQVEWDSKVAELFARFDMNNDRVITRPEVRRLWQSNRVQR